jgi:hypothetical protein
LDAGAEMDDYTLVAETGHKIGTVWAQYPEIPLDRIFLIQHDLGYEKKHQRGSVVSIDSAPSSDRVQ